MDKIYLLLEIIEDIEEYGADYPVYAIYENDLISDYWYVEEPNVGSDMEGTRILMEHYEELDLLDEDSVRKMSLLELLNRLRVQWKKKRVAIKLPLFFVLIVYSKYYFYINL